MVDNKSRRSVTFGQNLLRLESSGVIFCWSGSCIRGWDVNRTIIKLRIRVDINFWCYDHTACWTLVQIYYFTCTCTWHVHCTCTCTYVWCRIAVCTLYQEHQTSEITFRAPDKRKWMHSHFVEIWGRLVVIRFRLYNSERDVSKFTGSNYSERTIHPEKPQLSVHLRSSESLHFLFIQSFLSYLAARQRGHLLERHLRHGLEHWPWAVPTSRPPLTYDALCDVTVRAPSWLTASNKAIE